MITQDCTGACQQYWTNWTVLSMVTTAVIGPRVKVAKLLVTRSTLVRVGSREVDGFNMPQCRAVTCQLLFTRCALHNVFAHVNCVLDEGRQLSRSWAAGHKEILLFLLLQQCSQKLGQHVQIYHGNILHGSTVSQRTEWYCDTSFYSRGHIKHYTLQKWLAIFITRIYSIFWENSLPFYHHFLCIF